MFSCFDISRCFWIIHVCYDIISAMECMIRLAFGVNSANTEITDSLVEN